jgi:hypothetical protein
MFNAKTIDNVVSKDEVNYILNIVKNVEPWDNGGGEYWDNRVLNAMTIYKNVDQVLGQLLYDIRVRVQKHIESLYSEEVIYPDLFQVVRWFPGMEQPPHIDDMTDAPDHDWFHHRNYGAIIYLNDDYSGGETYYPQHDISIKPKSGMLAIHPGDNTHYHGVSKVSDGIRYTLASFWTRDKEYFDNWII